MTTNKKQNYHSVSMFLFLFFLPFSSLNQSIDEWSVSPQTDKVWNMCVHCINILALHKHNICMKSLPAFLLVLQLFNTAGHVTQQTPSALWCQYSMASEHLPHTFSSTTIQEYKDSALCLRAMTGTKGTTVENCPYFPSTTSLINLSPSTPTTHPPCLAQQSKAPLKFCYLLHDRTQTENTVTFLFQK